MINYQGKITTPEGALVDTTVSIVFTIYNDRTRGTALWTETQSFVEVQYGIFSVLLGSVSSIPDSVFDGSIRYLGVKVGNDSEMNPRKAIVSVGYAYSAEMLDGVHGSDLVHKPSGDSQGDILIRDSLGWTRLPAGIPGAYYKLRVLVIIPLGLTYLC